MFKISFKCVIIRLFVYMFALRFLAPINSEFIMLFSHLAWIKNLDLRTLKDIIFKSELNKTKLIIIK